MEAIRIWLNGNRNYDQGVKLYLQFGTDELLKRMFREKIPSDFKKKKLLESLQTLLATAKPTAGQNKTVARPTAAVPPTKKNNTANETPYAPEKGWNKVRDEIEEALHKKWLPLFLTLMDKCSSMYQVALAGLRDPYKEIEAGKQALAILDLDDEIEELYRQRDYYLENKNLPNDWPYGEPCIDAKLIHKVLENHKKYVRTFKKRLKDSPDDVEAAKLLTKHEWFVTYYNSQINKC
jgi:hypothetical protein